MKGNESFLCKDDSKNYPILSELSIYDYDVFNYEEMDELIGELTKASKELTNNQLLHIEEIIELAKKCKGDKSTTLAFNPFLDRVQNSRL
jgi:hypothetical protein